jgi:pimeloyl-ACP methyl ester carboxylesterase
MPKSQQVDIDALLDAHVRKRRGGKCTIAVLLAGYEEAYFDQVRRSSIPLLILRGDEDARTPAFRVEGVAGLERVQNVELAAGHYVLYEQEDEVLERLDTFCGGR